ncbi:MAG: response regulator transcription factor [Rubrivivax sp.]|jgi:DNA-binding NarL/FixJ family response regulator|uniref:response regulator n=1 Tax=Ottowia sp. TaxID=1898956 RepID=UPI0011D494F0|nr:response regulator transcription factor [Ottowia sp.]MCC6814740.1 response regulator transcription factor [Rubrivivax sp.]MCZ2089627.1 response regulator transcription factor [Burkholderiales bacterium]TXI17375.1 MAG: response regulator transcription factor [Ottowia sp.]HNE60366.1 response regulator transcription factor [Ottowia sp.]HNI84951.1 response regulator transcription factor [Ottowia sp.]
MKAVLVIEDLPDIRSWLVDTVRVAFPDAEVTAIGRCGDGIDALARQPFDVVLTDLELPDGSGVSVIRALRQQQPMALSVVVTIHDDDEHLFPALQAGAFGYLLKEASRQELVAQLQRIADGEPPLSPPIARRMLAYFSQGGPRVVDVTRFDPHEVALNGRETDILQRVAKGYTLPEIAGQLNLSRHTVADYVKQIYRKLNVSSRAEAALEAARRGLVRP